MSSNVSYLFYSTLPFFIPMNSPWYSVFPLKYPPLLIDRFFGLKFTFLLIGFLPLNYFWFVVVMNNGYDVLFTLLYPIPYFEDFLIGEYWRFCRPDKSFLYRELPWEGKLVAEHLINGFMRGNPFLTSQFWKLLLYWVREAKGDPSSMVSGTLFFFFLLFSGYYKN